MPPSDHLIFFTLRLPRIAAATIVGAALSVAGLLFQGLFRNPMADPYILGASGGAVAGAGLGIFFLGSVSLGGFSATSAMAFAGSVATMCLVYGVARRHGRTSPTSLLLAGFAISTMLANTSYVFESLDHTSGSGAQALTNWLRGSITTPAWPQWFLAFTAFLFSFLACLPLMRRLNALALGEDYTQQLGFSVEHTRLAIILLGALLTAISVALGGLLSFAGLIVPHIARLIFGRNHTRLLPACALLGGIFLLLADTLARTVLAPTELPVGILMAALGGPFFLYLLRRARNSYAL